MTFGTKAALSHGPRRSLDRCGCPGTGRRSGMPPRRGCSGPESLHLPGPAPFERVVNYSCLTVRASTWPLCGYLLLPRRRQNQRPDCARLAPRAGQRELALMMPWVAPSTPACFRRDCNRVSIQVMRSAVPSRISKSRSSPTRGLAPSGAKVRSRGSKNRRLRESGAHSAASTSPHSVSPVPSRR